MSREIKERILLNTRILKEQIREMAIGVYTFDELVLDIMFNRIIQVERDIEHLLNLTKVVVEK